MADNFKCTKMFALTILLFGVWTIANGIVVERNYHTYFKVEILSNHRGDNKKYHILQCPPVNNIAIPKKPEDMQVCKIIGNYTAKNERSQKYHPSIAGRIRSKLRTNVDYTHLKDHRNVKHKTVPKRESITNTVYNPDKLNYHSNSPKKKIYRKSNRRRNIHNNDQLIASTSPTQQLYENKDSDDEDKDEENNTKTVEEINDIEDIREDQEYYDSDAEIEDGNKSETDGNSTEENDSPLKYLGVRDIVRSFSDNIDKKQSNINGDASDNDDDNNDDEKFSAESESFFSNHETFANGDKWKGYQNAYHRDEYYNDHIFYDDEEDTGDYYVHKKMHNSF